MDLLTNLNKSRQQQNQALSCFFKLWHNMKLDLPLLLGILALAAYGLFVLYSASNANFPTILHQAGILALGLGIMCICAQISPQRYQTLAPWLFGFFIVMLLIVLGIGAISKGAQRWLSFGFFRFQPAEIMKLILPLYLAWHFKDKALPPNSKTLLISLAMIFIPAVLVAKQPDLGTAIMIAASGIAILFFTGIRWKLLLSSVITIAVSLPLVWHFLHDYQKARILTFLNPERDPLGSGYHIIQSKIAIGSGGLLGKGWLHGTQSHLQFLPEHTTDFIFAVLSEELGLIGCLILFGISLYIVGRGLYISSQGQDTFSRLLAAGLSLTFFFSFFVNVGMVIGILPVVGLPLPLVSYGGSSVITLMAGFGIIMSLHAHQKLLPS